MVRKTARYGWRPQLPGRRDLILDVPSGLLVTLPPAIDLRPSCPPVYDQGSLGSCTANATAALVQFVRAKHGLPDFVPSRLFIYWHERALEGSTGYDSGAQLRDGIKTVANKGVCPEPIWPYEPARLTVCPSDAAFGAAWHDTAIEYRTVRQTLSQMKACLAQGFPFIFGFTVYASFESDTVASSGIVPMPSTDDPALGGHAAAAVGYDDTTETFVVRNSWGEGWGERGYCQMPYAYLQDRNLASDIWTIRRMSA
jgi:C1A family cysteine protease